MKSTSNKEFQYRLNNTDWNLKIASLVFRERKHRRNISISIVTSLILVGISVIGYYQNSNNSNLAFSANDQFETIFTQDFNLQNISYILEE